MTAVYIKRPHPILKKVVLHFFKDASDPFAFVWGGTMYFTGVQGLPADLIAHEQTHITQQKSSKILGLLWWYRYIRNPQFRYKQELPAYINQLKYILKGQKKRDQRARIINDVALIMSGPMYNHMVPHRIALSDLRQGL